MSKESLRTGSMFGNLTFKTIEQAIKYDSAYKPKKRKRSGGIPSNNA